MKLALLLLTGCMVSSQLGVAPTTAYPNTVVSAAHAPASLAIAPEILDDFTIPATGSVRRVPVRGWRSTLESGFHNTFHESSSGRRLELLTAELSFAPAAVTNGGTTRAVVAQIRFAARLVDADGADLGALAGTASARQADVRANVPAMTQNAAMAVEAMYEQLSTFVDR